MTFLDRARFHVRRALPGARRRTPTVEWQTNGICNYDCSYCIQSPAFRTGAPTIATVLRFVRFFQEDLPGTWEIKMSGGEPFATKVFLDEVVPGLARTRHRVSVLTNFSAPLAVLERFVSFLGEKLAVVSTSLHLEFTDEDAFLEKAITFKGWLAPRTALVVNQVLVPGTLERVRRSRDRVRAAGIRWFPQLMKTKHGIASYAEGERALLRELLGDRPTPREANTAPSYKGSLCWSGVEYFVLSQTGDAYSCRTAKRADEGYLGNVLDGTFRLERAPSRCPYEICPCTVPANRGMIEAPGLVSIGREEEDA
ncbi:radical SAM protein [bacterium]|nr:radical SAM protein [bacterium]